MHTYVANIQPVSLRSPAVMTSGELATWAQVGKNSIQQLTQRFGIREITGNGKNHRYAVHEVLRKIIGVAPTTPVELEMLLKPLQKATWASHRLGLSVSAINAAVCEKRLIFPKPIELTHTKFGQSASRGRRWVPAQIDAYLKDDPIPFIKPPLTLRKTIKPRASDPRRNVFAAICTDNTEVPRQCQL